VAIPLELALKSRSIERRMLRYKVCALRRANQRWSADPAWACFNLHATRQDISTKCFKNRLRHKFHGGGDEPSLSSSRSWRSRSTPVANVTTTRATNVSSSVSSRIVSGAGVCDAVLGVDRKAPHRRRILQTMCLCLPGIARLGGASRVNNGQNVRYFARAGRSMKIVTRWIEVTQWTHFIFVANDFSQIWGARS
jgi:hypothetical protein